MQDEVERMIKDLKVLIVPIEDLRPEVAEHLRKSELALGEGR
jgi:hypothetical protein